MGFWLFTTISFITIVYLFSIGIMNALALNPQHTQAATPSHGEEARIWRALFERQTLLLRDMASPVFLQSVSALGLRTEGLPSLIELSLQLRKRTGFTLEPVPGVLTDKAFYTCLQARRFPIVTHFRDAEHLTYADRPDFFHHIYGHVPLLALPPYADFMQLLGALALPYADQPAMLELINRLYWYTIEFGLVQHENGLRIYGAGIVSSVAETAYCLGPLAEREAYDVQTVMATPIQPLRFQRKYFVIQHFRQLYDSLPELERVLKALAVLHPAPVRTGAAPCGVEFR